MAPESAPPRAANAARAASNYPTKRGSPRAESPRHKPGTPESRIECCQCETVASFQFPIANGKLDAVNNGNITTVAGCPPRHASAPRAAVDAKGGFWSFFLLNRRISPNPYVLRVMKEALGIDVPRQ